MTLRTLRCDEYLAICIRRDISQSVAQRESAVVRARLALRTRRWTAEVTHSLSVLRNVEFNVNFDFDVKSRGSRAYRARALWARLR